MGNVLFDRPIHLNFRDKAIDGKIVIKTPVFVADNKWRCDLEMSLLLENSHVWGLDPLYAFYCALFLLRQVVEGSCEDGWEIWWREKGDFAGLKTIAL